MSFTHFAEPVTVSNNHGNLSQPDNGASLHFVNTTHKGIGDMTVADLSRIIEQSCPGFFDYGQGVTALAL